MKPLPRINLKRQVLFSLKNNEKYLSMSSAAVVIGTLLGLNGMSEFKGSKLYALHLREFDICLSFICIILYCHPPNNII